MGRLLARVKSVSAAKKKKKKKKDYRENGDLDIIEEPTQTRADMKNRQDAGATKILL